MVDVVVLYAVALGGAVAVSPYPTDRNTRIAEIGDVVMGDLVVRRIEDDYAYGTWEGISSVLDDVVVDRDVVGYFGYIRPDHGFSDFNSAGSDVENFALFDRAVRAGSPEPNAAHSGVGNLARFEVYVAGKVCLDSGGYGCGSLFGTVS